MVNCIKSSAIIMLLIGIVPSLFAQKTYNPGDVEYYAMDKQQMNFDDYQTLLVNYRGFVSPRQYSTTQFTNVHFLPIESEFYNFNLNFHDKGTGRTIMDDVPVMWEKWIDKREGFDPLGSNFRPNSPAIMVTQDEEWRPNSYYRSGTFHKEYDKKWVSFSVKSWTNVAYDDDEVFIKLVLANRNSKDLNMTLEPNQVAENLTCQFKEGSTQAKQIDAFTIGSEVSSARVSSSIKDTSEKGFEISLAPKETKTYWFAVKFYQTRETPPKIVQTDIEQRMEAADKTSRDKLAWAYDRLPKLETANKQLEEYYYRCMLSVMMSRYENPNYISDVFWAVGTWPYTISWDTSYSSDIIAMLDSESLKQAILTDFENVKMKRTYVSWNGAFWDNLYIQEPFALKIMIEAYLRHTGDYSLFEEKAAGATVWEWMQRWVKELQMNYTNEEGLIDIGYNTEKIIEIRTDGYNHVVPITNTLTIDLLYKMAEWSKRFGDKKSMEYAAEADKLKKLVDENLWNEQEGWFDNLYADGSKGTIWTFHLLDLLGADYLPDNQLNRLVGHIQEGVFLGKYGLYSIAPKDTVHWDMIDSDWGGGGQYAGMPGRVSRYLYQSGFAGKGWDVLRRNMRYIDHFPYLPQNPRTDTPEQDRSSMPLEISAGAGMEAIIFGTFGIEMEDKKITFKPINNEDIGEAQLKNIKYRGRNFGVKLEKKTFSVYEDDTLIATKFYGESVTVDL